MYSLGYNVNVVNTDEPTSVQSDILYRGVRAVVLGVKGGRIPFIQQKEINT